MLVPFPFLTALVVIALSLRLARSRGLPAMARGFLTVAGLGAAGEAILVGLRFGYGVEGAIAYQRVLPLAIGPLLYLGFLTLAVQSAHLRRAAYLHLGAALTLIAIFSAPRLALPTLDFAIISSYVLYTFLMYRLWRAGPDALIRVRLSEAATLRLWLLGAIGLLIFVALLDTTIAAAFAFGLGDQAPLIISIGTAPLTVLFLYALTRRPVTVTAKALQPEGVFTRIDALIREARLYQDPDLTLSRLARRLGEPSRAVSQAINQATGLNVSQYVNQHRVEAAAAALLTSSETVEVIAQNSGFLSRSNFYREFQRIHGQTPAAYRKAPQTGCDEV